MRIVDFADPEAFREFLEGQDNYVFVGNDPRHCPVTAWQALHGESRFGRNDVEWMHFYYTATADYSEMTREETLELLSRILGDEE